MDFKRWIITAGVAAVSCVISILSLMVLREYGFVFSDNLLLEFGFITYAISTVSTYCVKKFLERYILGKLFPHEQICQQGPACPRKQEETSVFYNLPVDVSDRVQFRRRHSYPLQLSDYAFTNLVKTSNANLQPHDEKIVSEPDSVKKQKQTKGGSLKSKSSDNVRVILRECVREIDDIVEHLKLFRKSDISHQKVQSGDNSAPLSGVKHAKTKKEDTQTSGQKTTLGNATNKQEQEFGCLAPSSDTNVVPDTLDLVERLPSDSLDFRKDKGLQRASDVGDLSHGEDNEAAADSLSHNRKKASFSTNFDPPEHEEQVDHSNSDSLSLHEDNTACGDSQHSKEVLGATAHFPEVSEKLQPQSENNLLLSPTSAERKRTVGTSKHAAKGINSGIILDPVKLGQELKELGIFYSLDYETAASGYEPDVAVPNILDFPTREIELKDFACSQVTSNSANGAAQGSISNPSELGKELKDFGTPEDLVKPAMDNTTSNLFQSDSKGPADSPSYSEQRGNIELSEKHNLENTEKSKQEAKDSILSRFRNSFKFRIDAKDSPKKEDPRY